jgi:N-acetylglutamate synthase-like GNAT family acetyltransferase
MAATAPAYSCAARRAPDRKASAGKLERDAMTGRRLMATPLQSWERDGLAAALGKAGLPTDDIREPALLFWRFESYEDVPVGFGGLEIHGPDALLRSLVILPPLRQTGMGGAIVAALEREAFATNCRAVYLLTTGEGKFFAGLGYKPCARDKVPEQIRASRQFTSLCPASATVMVKVL